jgi:hypothetical protein
MELQRQLRTLNIENWRQNSEVKKHMNQFEKFPMEWILRRRMARCALPELPDGPCCLRRLRLQSTSRST